MVSGANLTMQQILGGDELVGDLRSEASNESGVEDDEVWSMVSVNEAEDDVELTEFSDEIDSWIIEEFKKIGLDTARSVLEQDAADLVKRTDLEEETVAEVVRILKSEFED